MADEAEFLVSEKIDQKYMATVRTRLRAFHINT